MKSLFEETRSWLSDFRATLDRFEERPRSSGFESYAAIYDWYSQKIAYEVRARVLAIIGDYNLGGQLNGIKEEIERL